MIVESKFCGFVGSEEAGVLNTGELLYVLATCDAKVRKIYPQEAVFLPVFT